MLSVTHYYYKYHYQRYSPPQLHLPQSRKVSPPLLEKSFVFPGKRGSSEEVSPLAKKQLALITYITRELLWQECKHIFHEPLSISIPWNRDKQHSCVVPLGTATPPHTHTLKLGRFQLPKSQSKSNQLENTMTTLTSWEKRLTEAYSNKSIRKRTTQEKMSDSWGWSTKYKNSNPLLSDYRMPRNDMLGVS